MIFLVVLAALTESRVERTPFGVLICGHRRLFIDGRLHGQASGVGAPERKGVSAHKQLHRIAQRGQLGNLDNGPGDEAHVQKMLTQLPGSAY